MGTGVAEPVVLFEQLPQYRPLRADVYETLREAVLLGRLAPGKRIVEAEIARQTGISRGPIREAVRQLEQDGLVEYRPRHGVFVAELTREGVLEAYTVRAQLEGLALRLAVGRITAAELTHLEGMLAQMREHARTPDAYALLHTDVAFHEQLCRISGNRMLLRLWKSLGPHAWTLFTGAQVHGYTLEQLAERHSTILDALRAGDPDNAERVSKAHTLELAQNVLEQL
jgi:DNA-binding GntR family transcriptional regulator